MNDGELCFTYNNGDNFTCINVYVVKHGELCAKFYLSNSDNIKKFNRILLISGLEYEYTKRNINILKFSIVDKYEIKLYSIIDCDRLLEIVQIVGGKLSYERCIAQEFFDVL